MAKKNTDTVKAMLTPGEFVIKRSSAKKIGYDKLEKANETGELSHMNRGGKVKTKKKEAKMPVVKGKRYPYTEKGKAAATKAKKMQFGGKVGGRLGMGDFVEFDEDSLGGNMRDRSMSYQDGGKVTSEGYPVHGGSGNYKVGE